VGRAAASLGDSKRARTESELGRQALAQRTEHERVDRTPWAKPHAALFEAYRARCAEGRFRLGDVLAWNEGDELIYSLGIQEHSTKKAKVAALTQSLKTMTELALVAGIDRVGLPRIGAGPAGLDWPRVKKILNEIGQETSVTLVVFEQFIREKPA
jgi:O-acetyl-ADP-ribose deacetylase (regulator of RNase III)